MPLIHWDSFFFLLFAVLACFFAVAVVISGNVVRMATYLVVSLGAVAGLFFIAGADFLGAMQLMVYVGGTLVLLAFGVMLTARGPFAYMRSSGGQWIMAALIGGSLLAVLLQTVIHVKPPSDAAEVAVQKPADTEAITTRLGMGLLGVRTDQIHAPRDTGLPVPSAEEHGQARGTPARIAPAPGYLLVFEIISVHLLVVLVGSAYLARAKRKSVSASPPIVSAQPQLAPQTVR